MTLSGWHQLCQCPPYQFQHMVQGYRQDQGSPNSAHHIILHFSAELGARWQAAGVNTPARAAGACHQRRVHGVDPSAGHMGRRHIV